MCTAWPLPSFPPLENEFFSLRAQLLSSSSCYSQTQEYSERTDGRAEREQFHISSDCAVQCAMGQQLIKIANGQQQQQGNEYIKNKKIKHEHNSNVVIIQWPLGSCLLIYFPAVQR